MVPRVSPTMELSAERFGVAVPYANSEHATLNPLHLVRAPRGEALGLEIWGSSSPTRLAVAGLHG